MPKYLSAIDKASERLANIALTTPLTLAPNLSTRLGRSIFLKREDLQPVFSFKLRGAFNKMAALQESETAAVCANGFITASAGNHAQGVAFAARTLGVKATIVMPETTPEIKVAAVKQHGAEWVTVVLHGDNFSAALPYSQALAQELNQIYVHPYDDEAVIAGQGTIAKELVEQLDHIDTIFIPVGGGGLLAGIAVYLKSVKPAIKIIGVESEESACLKAALTAITDPVLQANPRVILREIGIFADGVAVAQIGQEPFRIVKEFMSVDDVITVSTDEICAAIKDIFEDTRTVAEPAGALSIAGLKKYAELYPKKKGHWVAIVSGANVNFDRLRHIAERTELGEKREALLAVEIPEKPGSFLHFCELLGRRNITEFNYRYADDQKAHIFVGVQCHNRSLELQPLLDLLRATGYSVTDLSDNEMAKLHVRYMVGGRAPEVGHEELFRVQFPERPGALLDFLKKLGGRWNISLFHYRNHGAAYGRILMGLQVLPGGESVDTLRNLLEHYPCWEENDNSAYELFLK